MKNKVCYWDEVIGSQVERETTPEEDAEVLVRQGEAVISARNHLITELWQAAHDYEYAQISGSAIGLITMGVMQAKPKCLAVRAWIDAIWAEYYSRKSNGSDNFDFSSVGPCPYTVPELSAELSA